MCVLYGEEKCKIRCLKISMLKASAAGAYFISTILCEIKNGTQPFWYHFLLRF